MNTTTDNAPVTAQDFFEAIVPVSDGRYGEEDLSPDSSETIPKFEVLLYVARKDEREMYHKKVMEWLKSHGCSQIAEDLNSHIIFLDRYPNG